MSNSKKNTEDKIRDKLTSHEFEFAPEAWSQMEQMLDKPPASVGYPATDATQSPSWTKWLGALLALCLLLALFVTGFWNTNSTTTDHQNINTESLSTTTTAADQLQTDELNTQNEQQNSQAEPLLSEKDREELQERTSSNAIAASPSAEARQGSVRAASDAVGAQPATSNDIGSTKDGFGQNAQTTASTSSTTSDDPNASLSQQKQTATNPPLDQLPGARLDTDNTKTDQQLPPATTNDESDATAAGQSKSNQADQLTSGRKAFSALLDLPENWEEYEHTLSDDSRWLVKPQRSKSRNGIELGISLGILRNSMSSNSVRIQEVIGQINQSGEQFGLFGMLLRFRFNEIFSLQTEFNYHKLTTKYRLQLVSPIELSALGSTSTHVFSLPVLAQFNVGHGFRVSGGFAANLHKANKKSIGLTTPVPIFNELYLEVAQAQKDNKLQAVFMTGLGYDWRQFSLDLRYHKYLGSSTNPITYEVESYRLETRTSNISLQLSYRLPFRKLLGR